MRMYLSDSVLKPNTKDSSSLLLFPAIRTYNQEMNAAVKLHY